MIMPAVHDTNSREAALFHTVDLLV